jgi:hypothetical protein
LGYLRRLDERLDTVVTDSTKPFEDPIALTRLPQVEDQAA